MSYCPTYRMLADFFTKPLQGSAYNAYRKVIMGWVHISELEKLLPSSIKERVEKRHKKEFKRVIEDVKNFTKSEEKNKLEKTYTQALLGEKSQTSPHSSLKIPFTNHSSLNMNTKV